MGEHVYVLTSFTVHMGHSAFSLISPIEPKKCSQESITESTGRISPGNYWHSQGAYQVRLALRTTCYVTFLLAPLDGHRLYREDNGYDVDIYGAASLADRGYVQTV